MIKSKPNILYRQIQTTRYIINPIAIAIAITITNTITITIVKVPYKNVGNRFFYNSPIGSKV